MAKIKDAILNGCQAMPDQQKDTFYSKNGFLISCCVLGAAWAGDGRHPDEITLDGLREAFPVLGEWSEHPVQGYEAAIDDICVSLNDVYDWTREAIAEWLENEEAKCAS